MDSVGIYISVAVVLLFLSYILKVTTDTRADVRMINGRLVKVEERLQGHRDLSEERHKVSERRFEKLGQ